ncbi:c-type cytochrome [Tunturiibacter lichenicola]|uniref:c-type cytochrome n=1 Tax=Tunturiibacter lichenicola TaxID=2051959 RepID=UPI0021B361C0|nr:cytochrome c [Edaphobacter lichenicola]
MRHAVTTSRLILLSLLSSVLLGCSARPPSRFEIRIAYWTKRHITVRGKSDINPVPATAENIEDGKQAFTSYCMVCHGLDGQNTGVPFAASVSPPVPSLASTEVQTYTDGQLKWIIKNGIYPSGMPPSAGDFSDDDMWRMVLYIRHLPKAGSLGEPAVYSGATK